MLELGLKIFISYLVGSLNGSLFIGWLRGGVDVRKVGSGNAGGTNALRTQGKVFAFWVMLIDLGKGVLPPLLLPALIFPGVGIDPEVSRDALMYAVGFAAIVGHCYPVWFEFEGGKGAATTVGVLAAVNPTLLIPVGIAWGLVLLIGRVVGIATVAAALMLVVYVSVTSLPDNIPLFAFGLATGLGVVFTHRGNIRKLLAGSTERDLPRGSDGESDSAA
jgi:glycerol-3-phosphate acyltransferase PlsY